MGKTKHGQWQGDFERNGRGHKPLMDDNWDNLAPFDELDDELQDDLDDTLELLDEAQHALTKLHQKTNHRSRASSLQRKTTDWR